MQYILSLSIALQYIKQYFRCISEIKLCVTIVNLILTLDLRKNNENMRVCSWVEQIGRGEGWSSSTIATHTQEARGRGRSRSSSCLSPIKKE